MQKTGAVNLPLHGGKAPRWLFERMVKLSGAITEVILYEYGQEEFLKRISNPYWFQAFGCVLGFDWHSSGVTTTTCGALKMAVNPQEHGIFVAGGKGRTSRKTPEEIEKAVDLFSLSSKKIDELKYSSRMSAKVDNSCVQDNYQLYHHIFIFTEKSKWVVVQQGMNDSHARRYHWMSDNVESFVEEPHSAICCDRAENALDMTSKENKEARKISVDLVKDGPVHLEKYLTKKPNKSLMEFSMPEHHWIKDIDVGKQGMKVLQRAYELQPDNYEELVSLKGMGPKRIRALALISDLVYGSGLSWKDPVKYSFAHGGKDGTPYPVNRQVYDSSIKMLKDSLENAKLNNKERLGAIRRLNTYIKAR